MEDISQHKATVADALPRHWADTILPERFRPYARLARLERPIGWWLLLLPGWWAILLAALEPASLPNVKAMCLFLIGAIIMRGAGCTLNDLADRNFDGAVERTRSRPIPAGQVSLLQAAIFMLCLLAMGFLVLLQFNWFSVLLGAASLIVVAVYPFMKRYTYWPQLFLGMAFNWGALLGWVAVRNELSVTAITLYLGGICWTLAYDTIYAHQDREDDLMIGLKSTALKFGPATGYWVSGFFAAAVILIGLAGMLAGASVIFYTGLAGAALHATWQIIRLDIDDQNQCLQLFRSNRNFGLIIVISLLIDVLSRSMTLN